MSFRQWIYKSRDILNFRTFRFDDLTFGSCAIIYDLTLSTKETAGRLGTHTDFRGRITTNPLGLFFISLGPQVDKESLYRAPNSSVWTTEITCGNTEAALQDLE